MPNTGAWKAFERRVATLLGTRRTPLSGRMSGHHTSSDTLSMDVYVECKWLSGNRDAGSAAFTLWEATVKAAKREDKIPLLAMHRRGSKVEFGALPLVVAIESLRLYIARNEPCRICGDE